MRIDFLEKLYCFLSPSEKNFCVISTDMEAVTNHLYAKEESTTSSPSSTIKAEKVDLDLSIIGERVEIQNDAANDDVAAAKPTDEESDAVFDASNKDFIRIIHGDRQIMLIMPSEVSNISFLCFASLDVLCHKN